MNWEEDDDGVEEALSLIATTDLMYDRRKHMTSTSLRSGRYGWTATGLRSFGA